MAKYFVHCMLSANIHGRYENICLAGKWTHTNFCSKINPTSAISGFECSFLALAGLCENWMKFNSTEKSRVQSWWKLVNKNEFPHVFAPRISENFAFGNTWKNEWIFFCRKVNTYLFLDMMSAFQLCNFFLLATSNTDSWSSIISCGCEVLSKSTKTRRVLTTNLHLFILFPASQKCFDLIMCDFLWP